MMTLMVMGVVGGLALVAAPFLRRDSTLLRQLVIAFTLITVVRYVIWRIWALPRFELAGYEIAVYVLLGLELLATLLAMEDLMVLKRTHNRSAEVQRQLDWYGEQPPRVDILIATYNESWEVLEKTVVGATSQNYPNYRVWVLDDGNRAWLKQKANDCGLGYVARTNNTHFKAGNLNNGVAELRKAGVGLEFLALLDADFIARPEFLRRTLALMKAEDIGIVQTPQCFYNPDPHQLALGGVANWPDEQRGWFDVYLPALDALGGPTCCGTSCLIRVSALEAIGGFPTASVSEDTLTSLKMQAKGLRTVFLHERLTVGLAPESIAEFLTQRARWLLGGVQNTRHLGAGPGLKGRLRYWLTLWQLAIWGIMPLLWVTLCIQYWFTKVTFLQITDAAEAFTFFAPMWLARLFQGWLFGGRQQVFVSDAIWMLLAPLWVKDTFRAVTGSKGRFKVTDKAQHRDRATVHWRLLAFHGCLAVLLVTGFLYAMFDPTAPTHHEGFWQANTLMTAWFLCVIVAGVAPMFEAPRRRTADRYGSSEPVIALVQGRRLAWICENISLGGILVRTGAQPERPPLAQLQLDGLEPIPARLVRAPAPGLLAFVFESPAARPALIRRLYGTDDYILSPQRWSLTSALCAFVKRALL
jgi:cellulose synthase (UDP-forming)